jgi:hypothetical protein
MPILEYSYSDIVDIATGIEIQFQPDVKGKPLRSLILTTNEIRGDDGRNIFLSDYSDVDQIETFGFMTKLEIDYLQSLLLKGFATRGTENKITIKDLFVRDSGGASQRLRTQIILKHRELLQLEISGPLNKWVDRFPTQTAELSDELIGFVHSRITYNRDGAYKRRFIIESMRTELSNPPTVTVKLQELPRL